MSRKINKKAVRVHLGGLIAEYERLLEKMSNDQRQGFGNHIAGANPADTNSEFLMTVVPTARCIREQLLQARHASARLEVDTYGLCEVCGKEINPERLEVLPTATKCIQCA